jgi:glucose-1-phosphate adenylyltransferase
MSYPKVLAMVMAGGEGTRLHPLTAERSKPAVPFAGRYRIVDFVLSNLVNSGIHLIYLLVQYKSQSLIEHISRAWVLSHVIPGQSVSVVPPQMREGPEWFHGTADAVFQNRNLILLHRPALVAVFGADHIYRMDVRQMVQFHLAQRAEVTVAALPVPLASASRFGIVTTQADGRIADFLEKPGQAAPMAGRPGYAYASMGNYLFNTEALLAALDDAGRRGESDFGRDILPRLIGECRVIAYDFSGNAVPGVRAYEEPAYWRDVGTIDAYYEANMDTLGVEPRFNLFNPLWFINSSNYQGPVPRILDGRLCNTCIGAGTVIKGGSVRNSIIRREVMIEPDVDIEDSVIMDYVTLRRGSRLRRVIVDRYNEIAAGEAIGFDARCDAQRFHVSEAGVTVVPKGIHFSGPFHYH